MYYEQSDLEIDKYWNELLQVLTEDENSRIRKTEMIALLETDVVEFYGSLKFFDKRMEERLAQIKKLTNK